MIRITPSAPPPSFAFHRASKSTYKQLSSDPTVRLALFNEQRGLCAYCERPLVYSAGQQHTTRIDHFHPQHLADVATPDDPACATASGASPLSDSTTTWTNLLLCCDGDEDRGVDNQHCDVSKRGTDICATFRNPKTYAGQRLLEVQLGGIVAPIALPAGAERVINEVLMLNRRSLTTVRERLYGSLLRAIAQEKKRPPFGLTQARRKALRAGLEEQARTNSHPSVFLSVAATL